MSDRISIAIADGVADVRLTRSDKMNALDPAMFGALAETCDRLGKERGRGPCPGRTPILRRSRHEHLSHAQGWLNRRLETCIQGNAPAR
jgi:hypothetical protein